MKSKKFSSIVIMLALLLSLSAPASASYSYADNVSQIIGNGNTVVFVDVPRNYWAREQIDYFTQQGIVDGYPDGTFKPGAGVTREEFCKILVSTFKTALETPETATFSDVLTNRWSYPYVETCKEFLTGYTNPFGGMPTFHPKEYATREDIAVALVRMMGLTESDAKDKNYAARKFSDGGSISPSLMPYVGIACERNLISGYPDGTFGPSKGITRAEAVVMLNRATKQAVTDINAELELAASVLYSSDGMTATVNIIAEEGTSVTVNGEAVKMSSNYDDEYEGNYVYKFEQEGSKDFVVEGKKAGKVKTVNVTVKYEIGVPQLTIMNCPETSDQKEITIWGTVSDKNDPNTVAVKVTVNGEFARVESRGNWSKNVTLKEGDNTFTITATNSLGKTATEVRTVTFGAGAPTLKIVNCPEVSDQKEVTIWGTVSDANDKNAVKVAINGNFVVVESRGNWSKKVTLKEGDNTFTITATNSLGKTATEMRTITFGVEPPTLIVTNCPEVSDKDKVVIGGNVSDVNDGVNVKVTINGNFVGLDYHGNWGKEIKLKEGKNTVTIVATNSLGKSVTEERTIEYIPEDSEI